MAGHWHREERRAHRVKKAAFEDDRECSSAGVAAIYYFMLPSHAHARTGRATAGEAGGSAAP